MWSGLCELSWIKKLTAAGEREPPKGATLNKENFGQRKSTDLSAPGKPLMD